MRRLGHKTGIARCVAPAWLALLVASAGSAMPAELWRGVVEEEPCRIEVRSEATELRLSPGGHLNEIVVEGDPRLLAIETRREGGRFVLEVDELSGQPRGVAGIELPSACSVSVESGSGSVVIDGGEKWLSYSVSTATGTITAYLDPGSDTLVELATSGEITVDFSIRIERAYHQEPSKRGRVVIGNEGSPVNRRVRLTSRQGAISILRRPEESGETPDRALR